MSASCPMLGVERGAGRAWSPSSTTYCAAGATKPKRDDDELLELVVVRTGQHQFSEVVRDYLKRVTYGNDGWASRLRLPSYQRADVVVDPKLAFGLPLVVHGGARVEDLVDRFVAGDSVAEISYDFDVPPEEVEDVIRVATRTAA